MAYRNPLHRYLSVNGIRLHYLDWGGDGPPALLHHATGFHAWMWAPIARELAAHRRVIALDARGHGDSDKPEGGYSWQVFIADLIAFVEELGLQGSLAIGHSLGGTVIAGAAAERTDLFERIVLVDPVLWPREGMPSELPPDFEAPIATMTKKRRERWTSTDEAFESYRGRGPFAGWQEEALRLYVEHGFESDGADGVRLKCPPAIEAQVFAMAPRVDTFDILTRVQTPALLLRGETSDALPAAEAERAAGSLSRGTLVTVPATSHFIPMENPEAVVREIERFAGLGAELPIATRGLGHLALKVRRLEETVAFYQDVFGMRIVWQPDADNVYLSSGRDNLALHRAREERPENGSPLDHLGFLVDRPEQVYAAAAALERRGVPLAQAPREHRDGSHSLYVKDPDGNVVQVLYEPNLGPA